MYHIVTPSSEGGTRTEPCAESICMLWRSCRDDILDVCLPYNYIMETAARLNLRKTEKQPILAKKQPGFGLQKSRNLI